MNSNCPFYTCILTLIGVRQICCFSVVVWMGPHSQMARVLHIFPWINGSRLKYEKFLCFPSWGTSTCCGTNRCVFASVTVSRWRSLFSSPASLAFPYSPVARLSPYSNGISTPSSSKTSNKAILTPERTGNIPTSWPAACFATSVTKRDSQHLLWGSRDSNLVSWRPHAYSG